MFLKLFLAFTLIPVVELYLLIRIGAAVGALNTILLVVITGAAGAYLARVQGLQTMTRVRQRLHQGEMPAEDMLDAVLIFVAGIVLLTPGLLTDAAGLLLLFPPSRREAKKWLRRKMDRWIKQAEFRIHHHPRP